MSNSYVLAPMTFAQDQRRRIATTPVYYEVITWVLFFPLLFLIARHIPYFSGPAVSASSYQNGGGDKASTSVFGYVVNLVLIYLVWLRGRQIIAALSRNKWIFFQMFWGFTSALWASAPQVSLQMSIGVSLCTLFAFYLSVRFSTEHFMRLLLFMGVVATLMSVFFVFALPSYGVFAGYAGGAWQGITDQKNSLGVTSAFLLTPIFFIRGFGIVTKATYVTLLLAIIMKSQSRGAWMETAAMLSFVTILHFYRRMANREAALFILVIALCFIMLSTTIYIEWDAIARLLGKDASMSGRTGIYTEVWKSAMKRPLSGYGFSSFWGLNPSNVEARRIGMEIGWLNIGYAENGFLEILIQLGFIGVGLIMGMFVKALVQGFRLLRSPAYNPRVGWFLTIIFLALLTNIEAGWLMTVNTVDWLLIVMACIGLGRETDRARDYRRSPLPA